MHLYNPVDIEFKDNFKLNFLLAEDLFFLLSEGMSFDNLICNISYFYPDGNLKDSGGLKGTVKDLGQKALEFLEKEAIKAGAKVIYCQTSKVAMRDLLVRNGYKEAFDNGDKDTCFYKIIKK